MPLTTFAKRHPVLVQGLGLSLGIGFLTSLVGQSLVPVLAKLPGLLLCAGGEFELVMRRRTSYGTCSGAEIHYAIVALVSGLVWSVVVSPVGFLLARWRAASEPRGGA